MDPLIYGLAFLTVWLALAGLVARTAAGLGRSPVTWFLWSLLFNPLLIYLVLLLVGDARWTAEVRERQERLRQKYPDRSDLWDAAVNETACPYCGATVNPVTGDGLHTPEAEPWRLICDRCQGTIEPDV